MFARQPSMYFQALQCIVCVTFCSNSMSSTMIVAELHGNIQRAIPGIMECLKDSDKSVCQAAINGLISLAAHCMCYLLFLFDFLNHGCSGITWRYSKSHSWHYGMSEGFRQVSLPGSHQWTYKPCSTLYVLPSVPIQRPQP